MRVALPYGKLPLPNYGSKYLVASSYCIPCLSIAQTLLNGLSLVNERLVAVHAMSGHRSGSLGVSKRLARQAGSATRYKLRFKILRWANFLLTKWLYLMLIYI